MRKKVVVAMSGGVDSSVAAGLLKQQGYDVSGIMLRLWSEAGREDDNRCCSPDSIKLARRVAARLEIPFHVLDAREVFQYTVLDYFLRGYLQGETPNPCVLCNRVIKWDFLYKHAMALEADALATGHYASTRQLADGTWQLLRGVDRSKDQSYVLHVLTQEKLARALFPLGMYEKTEIRIMAAEMGLPTAARKDSQDLCFLSGNDYRDFLKRHAPESLNPGDIVTHQGKILGRHIGLAFYTIGQRRGLDVHSQIPLYVLEKQPAGNQLVVGTKEELGTSSMFVEEMNWISGKTPIEPARMQVKTRYSSMDCWATVSPTGSKDDGSVIVRFDDPQRDITPGQAAVFYDGEVVLAGGRISGNPPTG